MKLLLDMNIPPSLAERLESAGHQAVHWSQVGDPRASDTKVLEWARANHFVLITHDLDFGALLAAGGDLTPSVFQLRTGDLGPDAFAPMLIEALDQVRDALEVGSLVTVSPAEARIRILPLKRE
ncbi:MAG: DUF5615 family PIN-like protein [Steroidobacteraceae bacterium]|nr:DUF5615 family PIN-like protein [Steroidobacteraceae bacterium]